MGFLRAASVSSNRRRLFLKGNESVALKTGLSGPQLESMGLRRDGEWGIIPAAKKNWDAAKYTRAAGESKRQQLGESRNGHANGLPSEVNKAALNELSNLNENLRRSRATLREIDKELAFFEEKRRSILSMPDTAGDALDVFLATGTPKEGRIQRLDELKTARQRERVAQAAIVALDEQRFSTYSDKLKKQGRGCIEKNLKAAKEGLEAVIRAND
jgi:hypothetical protein